jgi:hypothetical protein
VTKVRLSERNTKRKFAQKHSKRANNKKNNTILQDFAISALHFTMNFVPLPRFKTNQIRWKLFSAHTPI